jgi:hypothetical protein
MGDDAKAGDIGRKERETSNQLGIKGSESSVGRWLLLGRAEVVGGEEGIAITAAHRKAKA